jgi:hypothetical protein
MNFMFNLEDYETVEERLAKFWKDHPKGRIETKLIYNTPTQYIVWSAIYRDSADIQPWATGLAEETVQGRGVNSTSACENAETSSLGRSLANAGYATKGKRASREEMQKVAKGVQVTETIQATKAKMADTAKEYVPVAKADDPWTTWEAAPVQTVETAVETVKSLLGGTAPDESCIHGARIWKHGVSKTGNKPWGHWRCPAQATRDMPGGEVPCDPIWYEVKPDGTWGKREERG